MKDYLLAENTRNHQNHKVYERLLRAAIQPDCDVLIGHHLTFTLPEGEPNEIPSADTLIFDFELMKKVFGSRAASIVEHLAVLSCTQRDLMLEEYLNLRDSRELMGTHINALARA